jgi:hypothetical protein
MWKGSGYRGETLPNNKNSLSMHNAVYVENLGRLSVAFPFTKISVPTSFYSAQSMCLGLFQAQVQAPDNEADPPVPAIYAFYLSHGQGLWQFYSSFPTVYSETVINGYAYFFTPTSGTMGYDTPRAREQYRGAVVNVTFTPGPTLSPVTTDVIITDDLFPDNLNWSGSLGIYIGTYTWPAPTTGLTWDQPYWTINSLTMP